MKVHQGIEPSIYIKIREMQEPELHEYKVCFERTCKNKVINGCYLVTESTPLKAVKSFYYHHLKARGIYKALTVTDEKGKTVWRHTTLPNECFSNI